MTKLPLVTERSVQPTREGGGYYSVRANADQFGAGVGRALQGLAGNLGQLAQVEAAVRDRQAATQAQEGQNEFLRQRRNILFNPDTGVFARRGTNATGVVQDAEAQLEALRTSIGDTISDPKAREAYLRATGARVQSELDAVARHELSQLEVAAQEQQQALIENSLADAYNNFNNPEAIEEVLTQGRAAIAANARGLPDEAVAAADSAFTSQVHLAVITRYALDDPEAGLEYYEMHKDSINGADHVKLAPILQEALIERRARELVGATRAVSATTQTIFPAVRQVESSNLLGQVSSKGAVGLAQVTLPAAIDVADALGIPGIKSMTPEEFELFILQDELQAKAAGRESIGETIGQAYLDLQLRAYGGDMELALIAYNAGAQRADEFVRSGRDYSVLPAETQNYLDKVLTASQDLGLLGPERGVGFGDMLPEVLSAERTMQRLTPDGNWSIRNFSARELIGTLGWVDSRAAVGLDNAADAFRAATGKDIRVNGGGRSPQRNREVGGAINSQHLQGTAFDLDISGLNDAERTELVAALREQGFNGFGVYGTHLHADMRSRAAKWGPTPQWFRDGMGRSVEAAGVTAMIAERGQLLDTIAPQRGPQASTVRMPLELALAQIAQESNSSVRERAAGLLRAEYAAEAAERAAREAALKRAAWEATLEGGSVQAIPPEVRGALDPSYINSMASAAEKFQTGQQTDWAEWSRLRTAIAENPALFTTPAQDGSGYVLDPYDYRPVLADAEFRQLLEMQESAFKALREQDASAASRLARFATPTQVLNNLFDTQGWSRSSTSQQKLMGQVSSAFFQQLEQTQRALQRELTPTEMQDLAEKLVIQEAGSLFGGRRPAEIYSTPEAFNDFIPYRTWSEVPADDRARFQAQYQRYAGRAPTREEALRLYTDGFRVLMGGEVEIDPGFVAAYTARYPSRSRESAERAYRDYLVSLVMPGGEPVTFGPPEQLPSETPAPTTPSPAMPAPTEPEPTRDPASVDAYADEVIGNRLLSGEELATLDIGDRVRLATQRQFGLEPGAGPEPSILPNRSPEELEASLGPTFRRYLTEEERSTLTGREQIRLWMRRLLGLEPTPDFSLAEAEAKAAADSEARAAIIADRDALRNQLEMMQQLVASGQADPTDFRPIQRRIERRLARIEDRLEELGE